MSSDLTPSSTPLTVDDANASPMRVEAPSSVEPGVPNASVTDQHPVDDFDLDDLEARLNRIGSLADDARNELHDPATAEAATETVSLDDAPDGSGSLRSQLAEMFGVDVNTFNESETRDGGSPESVPDDRSMRLDAAVDSDPSSGPTPAEPISFLPPVSDPPADVVDEPVATTPAAAKEPAPEAAPAGDDSIESYMERLLARSRGTEPTSPTPESKPATAAPAKPDVTDDLPPDVELASAAVVTARDRRFRKPINKDQLRREVSSLRELALQSSRAAVAKSRRAELRAQLQSRVVVVVVAAAVSGILLASPLWSRESFVLYGAAGVLVTVGVAVNFYRTYRKLAADLAAVQSEIDETDNAPAQPIHEAEPQLHELDADD